MKTAICVMIKDEINYLDEWLSWHLNLGIDEIFLYEDYGSKSHSHITKPYGDIVHLNSIDIIFNSPNPNKNVINTGERTQRQLFNYFPQMYKNDFDWILFNDVDEFLILKQPLHKLLEEYKDETAILLCWKWYGASRHINKPIGKVMDNYTKSVTTTFDWGWNFKSFLNCKNFKKWEKPIHKVEGGVFPLTDWGGHKAWLNHYFTKSWEEWKIKILERGDNFPGHRKIEHFFQLNRDMFPLKDDLLLDLNRDKKNIINDFNQYKNVMLKISDNYCVIEISKNGCTTVNAQHLLYNNLYSKDLLESIQYSHACKVFPDFFTTSHHIKDDCSQCKKIVIFRDPIDRFKSAWKNQFNYNTIEEFTLHVKHTFNSYDISKINQHINLQSEHFDFDTVDIFVDLKDYKRFCEDNDIYWTSLNQTNSKNTNIPEWCVPIIKEVYKKDYEMIEQIKESGKLYIPNKE